MILRLILFLLVSTFFFASSNAKPLKSLPLEKRIYEAKRAVEPIRVDGDLSELAWENASTMGEFTQYEPFNGSFPSEKTAVKFLYSDNAIYIGALLYDSEPSLIYNELGQRDNSDRLNADAFSVLISPYNDGINYQEFIVSASGVQTDIRHTGNKTDRSWDAVWESSVSITETGWIVELRIPFSALRFSSKTEGNWGLNFRRLIKRYNEWSSWNPIDNSISGIVNQSGELSGITDIKTPIRLSFSPYFSAYTNKFPGSNKIDYNINGGLDLQMGLSESFTLDMTLIPDFGQVKSDDKILNISPFEVRYGEQRPFFNEGMDLFQKGGIFYSRRVGTRPKGYQISDDKLLENEIITANPQETSMINATKISGRTSNGLGIGALNAMTSSTYATVRDTLTGDERRHLTQGFSNYNMMVFDQTLPNNSYISLVNTNLSIPNQHYISNVTAADFIFRDKANRFAFTGVGAISQIDDDDYDFGHKHFVAFHKTSGNLLYNAWSNTESKTYNPNDMGFIQRANEFSNGFNVGYRIYKPFWKLLSWSSWIGGSYNALYDPMVYSSSHLYISASTTFAKSYHSVGFNLWMDPKETHDYNEPRVEDWKVIRPRRFSGSIWTSSDYRKPLAIDTRLGYWVAESMGQLNYYASFSPRVRFSNNFFVVYQIRQDFDKNNIGYTGRTEDDQTIYMGMRDVSTLTNTIDGLYSFNANSFISLRIRHYWRWLDYSNYHVLNNNGSLSSPLDSFENNYNINYNLINLDLSYQWNFAPGSVLSVVWKNSIETSNTDVRSQFFRNFNNIINSEQLNSISFRVLYYLDYNTVMRARVKG